MRRPNTYISDTATLEIGAVDQETPEIRAAIPERRDLIKRILLLDDRTDFREVIQDYLAIYFSHITAVSNGAEGLREIVKDPFDLIICDMMMPQLNGEMFYWAVTRMRPAAAQRFIFFTGHQNNPVIQAFFQRINAVVLLKPFKLDALLAVAHEVLRKLR